MCQSDVSVGAANNKYVAKCHQPIRGQFFTIKNLANLEFDEEAQEYHGKNQCLNLCEVDVYFEGKILLNITSNTVTGDVVLSYIAMDL